MSASLPRRALPALALGVALAAGTTPAALASPPDSPWNNVIPAPRTARADPGSTFELSPRTAIHAAGAAAEVGEYLAGILRPATGFPLPVGHGRARSGDIALELDDSDGLGPAGYRLRIDDEAVRVRAKTPEGLFNGVQTLRQLLPAAVESRTPKPGPWTVPGGEIVDEPRFAHRAAMLDVARHFFGVEQVKRYIDQIALYKINYLHLHLTDDQGWRIQINSWPRLATYGGSTGVGGGPGGYYTQQDYREIVRYAASRHITVVPEIDLPGHTNAALASYAELNCDGVAPPLYTGIDVGFSSLCVDKDVTYRFVEDVIREVAALTPGPYLHIGGDEAKSTPEQDYTAFLNKVLPLVAEYGKTAVGWHDYAKAGTRGGAVVQYWGTETSEPLVNDAVARGNRVLLSPANKSYLDMKYDENTPLGLKWAGYVEVADAYDWDPGTHLRGVPADAVLGVEAPLWTETLRSSADIEYMAFPRLPAIAELGWSRPEHHDWASFRSRLAVHGDRLAAMGVHFYRSPQIPWR